MAADCWRSRSIAVAGRADAKALQRRVVGVEPLTKRFVLAFVLLMP
jgi:hypothetical protein